MTNSAQQCLYDRNDMGAEPPELAVAMTTGA